MLPEKRPATTDLMNYVLSFASSIPAEMANEIQTLCANAATVSASSPETLPQAKEMLASLRRAKKRVENWFAPVKEVISAAQSAMRSTIRYYTDQIDEHDKRLSAEIITTEKALKEQNIQRAKAAEEIAPWESIQDSPIPMHAIQSGPATVVKLPPAAEVVDKRAFLTAALAEGNEHMLNFITFDQPALNAEAKRLGRAIEQIYPGVKYVERETIRVR